MASLKEIKGRIASVQSTQKITSAMRMVASAKLHRTQMMTQNFLVYVEELQKILSSILPHNGEEVPSGWDNCESPSPLRGRVGERVCLIPISSGSGLCGAFNSNIAKATKAAISEYKSKGIEVQLIPIGKKILHDLKKEGMDCMEDFNLSAEEVGKGDAFAACCQLVQYLQDQLSSGKTDSVEFIYHHFHSMGKQVVTREPLDMSVPQLQTLKKEDREFITEPNENELLAELHPKMLNSKVYGIILDSVTSEHAARMLAMQTADDNAKELLLELTLLYNKSRQQAITNELIDIMGGKVSSN